MHSTSKPIDRYALVNAKELASQSPERSIERAKARRKLCKLGIGLIHGSEVARNSARIMVGLFQVKQKFTDKVGINRLNRVTPATTKSDGYGGDSLGSFRDYKSLYSVGQGWACF